MMYFTAFPYCLLKYMNRLHIFYILTCVPDVVTGGPGQSSTKRVDQVEDNPGQDNGVNSEIYLDNYGQISSSCKEERKKCTVKSKLIYEGKDLRLRNLVCFICKRLSANLIFILTNKLFFLYLTIFNKAVFY